jgi:peptidoglycan hydrolase CwlO-like protein
MSAQVDQFCDKLKDRLNTLEVRVKSAKTQIRDLPERGEKALRAKLDETRGEFQARKQRFEQAAASMKAKAQQKAAETKEQVNEWKAKHEVQKLNARADFAEGYAADAIDFAAATIDEADAAVLDAVVARLDADAAQ